MEAYIIISFIVAVASLIAIKMITKSIKTVFVSRSHLHAFNRKAQSLLKEHREELATLNTENSQRIEKLEKDLTNLRNTIAFQKR